MLGKLIKYDFKSLNRYLILIHGFLVLSAVAVRVFLTAPFNVYIFENSSMGSIMVSLLILYFVIITGTSFATSILIAVRFYKNLYSDEGYLTFTLPVTRSQLLVSKTIVGTVWIFINQLLIFACMALVIWTPDVSAGFHDNKEIFWNAFGLTGEHANLSFGTIIAAFLVFLFIDAVSSVTTIYASVSIGQLFRGHRIVGAVVTYLGLTTIIAIISYVMMTILGFFNFTASSAAAESFNSISYMIDIFKLSGIIALLSSVIFYVVTHMLMKKNVNLN